MHILPVLAFAASFFAGVTKATFFSSLSPCPDICAGKPENWTVYSSVGQLDYCTQPVLLDFAIYTPIGDSNLTVKIRTCTIKSGANATSLVTGPNKKRDSITRLNVTQSGISSNLGAAGSSGNVSLSDLQTLLTSINGFLASEPEHSRRIIFGHAPSVDIGVYAGEIIDASSALEKLADQISRAGVPESMLFQLCGGNRTAQNMFGASIEVSGDLAAVQKSVGAWNYGLCSGSDMSMTQPMTLVNMTSAQHNMSSQRIPPPQRSALAENKNTSSSPTTQASSGCRTITVVANDGCGTLASECGISGDLFMQYNNVPNLCSSLAIGQKVCCSPGGLPVPQQNPDGSCATYTVQMGEGAHAIAVSNGLQDDNLSTFNDGKTWGWFGKDDLQAGSVICLSTGTMPMPAPIPGALCGPVAPNTTAPSPITADSLAALNPCPLNSCCDIWGQCGITAEFCTAEIGPTGNPGTAPPNQSGCISNCGTNITNNAQGPSSQLAIGYYESWNWDRPCLNMRTASIGPFQYTHVHWGFGTIGKDFGVSVNDTFGQWGNFTALRNVKKIISFGGWGYSTDPATYDVLRSAMDPANVGVFTDNIVNFLTASNLGVDGVDIDWEYPGAPDIPGIPAGLASDGPNYLNFLKVLRGKLPSGKTMSIAAPASYWYLRAFPIANMSSYLDYIVYMTYDLHGQWDYGNKYSQEGCKSGSCLRSHINSTETEYTLAMITKAGVPSNKIAVGVSSYGRSFGMTTPGCTGPDCTFGGSNNQSTAEPGKCTNTAGYISNYEINVILELNSTSAVIQSYYDAGSDSNILVYNHTNWVAYMDDNTKTSRTNWYKSLNFAGTVDWAIDLQADSGDDGDPTGDDDGDPDAINLPPCTNLYADLDALDADSGNIPLHCSALYTLNTLSTLFAVSLKNYTDLVNNHYDKKFHTYAQAVSDGASQTVHNWITTNGSYAFTCIVGEASFCCDTCSNNDNSCKYCRNDKGSSCTVTCTPCGGCRRNVKNSTVPPSIDCRKDPGILTTQPVWKWVNETEPCPPDYSQRGYGPGSPQYPQDYEQSVWWTMKPDQADKFYADLLTNTGVPKDKTIIGDYNRGNTCPPSTKPYDGDNCWADGFDYSIVMPNGYGINDVANPKDVVSKALSLGGDLGPQISSVAEQIKLLAYMDNMADVVDAVSMPVLMFVQAVYSMQQVADTANQIDAEKRKAIILAFVGAILFFIPIVGEVAGTIEGIGDLAAILSLVGDAGNAAMDIYTLVADPQNAPLAIMGLIFAPAALADAANILKAANIRRGLEDSEIAKLGTKISDGMGTIRKINGKCVK